jgi:hypothetical protein
MTEQPETEQADRQRAPDKEAEQWQAATQFAAHQSELPFSILALVRVLVADEEAGATEASNGTKFTLIRLLKSEVFRAPYYYCVSLFRPEALRGRNRPFSITDFLQTFSPAEHAFFTAMIFMFKKSQKTCAGAAFEEVAKRMQLGINLGWSIGSSLKELDPLLGLLVGTFRWLGTLPFLQFDPEGFESYLRHCNKLERVLPDTDYELERWGCTSSQVGLLLTQKMGFKSSLVTPVFNGTQTSGRTPVDGRTDFICRATDIWLRHFLKENTEFNVPLPAEFYLNEADRQWIASCIADATPSRSLEWLFATTKDISPSLTPELFIPDPKDQFADVEGFKTGPDGSILLDE